MKTCSCARNLTNPDCWKTCPNMITTTSPALISDYKVVISTNTSDIQQNRKNLK